MRHKCKKHTGRRVFAGVLLFLGCACLCCVSYRLMLLIIAAALIISGIVILRHC